MTEGLLDRALIGDPWEIIEQVIEIIERYVSVPRDEMSQSDALGEIGKAVGL